MRRSHDKQRDRKKYDSQALDIRRVMKTVSQGNRLRFRAVVVAGDRQGSVGVGLGRGGDTRGAVEKGYRAAEKSMTKINLVGDTIPHEIVYKKGSAKVMLRPARPGTGVIAGSSVRTVLELCGIDNVYGKILGSRNAVANAYCTFEALKQLESERVLDRMSKMRDRIKLKEEIDKEKRRRFAAAKEASGDDKKGKDKSKGKSKGRGSKSSKKTDKTSKDDSTVDKRNDESKVAAQDSEKTEKTNKTVRVKSTQKSNSDDNK